MTPNLPLLAAAAALQLLLRCGGASTSAAAGELPTKSYLGSAVDSANLFHWTPRAPGAAVQVDVVLHNAPSELPPGLDAFQIGSSEVETLVADALQEWIRSIPDDVDLRLHAHGGSPPPGAEVCALEIRFESGADSQLSGFAWLETSVLDPRRVDSVQVRLAVPPQPSEPSVESLQALLLHELGHALGIVAPLPHTGHSPARTDVMHPEVHWTRLSVQDRLAIEELYALEPNLLRADGGTSAPGGPGGGVGPPPDASHEGGLLGGIARRVGQRLAPPQPPRGPAPLAARGAGCRDCR